MMYQKGEVVWAKVRGFPWWPGIVAKVSDSHEKDVESQLLVKFIGDESHAFLTNSNVAKFEDKYETFSKRIKKRRLLDSIDRAQKINTGQMGYEHEITSLEHMEFEVVNKRKKGKKSIKHEDDKESDSSTETGSKSPISERGSVATESESQKKEKLKRKTKTHEESKNLFLSMKETDKTVFRRTTLNSQNTQYTCEQFLEAQLGKTQRKPGRKRSNPSESISRTDSTRHIIEREFSDKASETPSSKNANILPIEHESSTSDLKTSMNKADGMIIAVTSKIEAVLSEEGIKTASRFKQQADALRKKLQELEDLLVVYFTNQNAVMVISSLIQECLNELSVESLSSSELMEYLMDDMGKLLYSLLVILEEFEKVALEMEVAVHPTLNFKVQKVKNLFSTLKTRAVSEFIEHDDFGKNYTEDLQKTIEQKELDKENKKKVLAALDEKFEQINKQNQLKKENELQEVKTVQIPQTVDKNSMEIEPMTNNISEDSKSGSEGLKLSENFSSRSNSSHQEKMTADTEDLKVSTPELNTRHCSAPQVLCPMNSQKDLKTQENLPPVPDQSMKQNSRAQSAPDFSSEPISNPSLRKQVVLKLVEYVQKKYDLTQEVAREKTMQIERKIRLSSPEMKEEYKKRYTLFIELLKANLITLDEFADSEKTDWAFLQAKLNNSSSQKKKSKVTECNKDFSQKSSKERSGKKGKSLASDEHSTSEDF